MIVAFDTYYYDGFSYTVAGVFEAWNSEKVKYFVCSRRPGIDAEYKPGELYKRELPCIMQCLEKINVDNVTSIIVDGFVWVVNDKGERVPGLGRRLQEAVLNRYSHHISIIGVAKNPYHTKIPNCKEVLRGKSSKPLYVTCTEDFFTEHYAEQVKLMFGEYRIPDILKMVDAKTRSYCEDVITVTPEEVNLKNKKTTLADLAVDMGEFDKWVEETKERGFSYNDAT